MMNQLLLAEHKVSRTTTALVVAKIVLGLGQVVSKQPEVVKEEFPGPQWYVFILSLVQQS